MTQRSLGEVLPDLSAGLKKWITDGCPGGWGISRSYGTSFGGRDIGNVEMDQGDFMRLAALWCVEAEKGYSHTVDESKCFDGKPKGATTWDLICRFMPGSTYKTFVYHIDVLGEDSDKLKPLAGVFHKLTDLPGPVRSLLRPDATQVAASSSSSSSSVPKPLNSKAKTFVPSFK